MGARSGRAFALALAVLAAACSRSEKPEIPAAAQPSGPRETVEFRVRLENTTGRALRSARVLLYAPVSEAAEQQADEVSASLPHELLRDALGNQRVYLELKDVAAGYSAEVDVKARIAYAAPAAKPAVSRRPGMRGRPVSAEVAAAAKSLKRESEPDTVQATFAWLEELAKQKADPLGAGLDSAGGRVALAVALLRANEIPARAVLGVAARDGKLSSDSLAVWVEYLLDGSWRRALAPSGERLVAMRVLQDPEELAGADWTLERLFEASGLRVRLES